VSNYFYDLEEIAYVAQLWTIIFLTLLAIGFGLAAWQDSENMKRAEAKRKQLQEGLQDHRLGSDQSV
jgi:hypothetical protein